MNKLEILQRVEWIKTLYKNGVYDKTGEKLQETLDLALDLKKVLDAADSDLKKEFDEMYVNGFYHLENGLAAQIYNLMNVLKKYDEVLPFLEQAIKYMDNDRNPEMWRILGLLYLAKENNLEEACQAWKKALELNPMLLEKYSGLNIVYAFDAVKKQGKRVTWKVNDLNLETGDFSVTLGVK